MTATGGGEMRWEGEKIRDRGERGDGEKSTAKQKEEWRVDVRGKQSDGWMGGGTGGESDCKT